MKRWRRNVILMMSLLAVAIVGLVAFPKETSQGIFYRVSGGKTDMYILGSIHIGSDKMYPMSREITNALLDTDVFVFECDTQSEQAQNEINALLHYAQGDELANHIGQDSYLQVQQLAEKLGYRMQGLDSVKPWGIVSMLSTEIACAQMGEKSAKKALSLGVEESIHREVRGRSVVYLETAYEQLNRMEHFSCELQEYLLQGACRTVLHPEQMSQTDKDTRNWPDWWAEGNAQAFATSYLLGMQAEEQPLLAREYHEALITERNKAMAEKLSKLLEGKRKAFVTVGLMHLVLPQDSILTCLEQMGYSVEKVGTLQSGNPSL